MINENKKRNLLFYEIIKELEEIDAKRKRCVDSQEKLGQTDSCSSCMNWMLHWGQINNLYGQIRVQIDKLNQVI